MDEKARKPSPLSLSSYGPTPVLLHRIICRSQSIDALNKAL